MRNIVILGAGPCGLSAAWELSRNGYRVTVIEKEPQVGGLCRTISYKGFRFDLGGHRFISRSQELIRKIQQLMPDELLLKERKSATRFKGRTYPYPLSAKDILTKLPLSISLRSLSDYLKVSLKQRFNPLPEVTFQDWALNRFGRSLYELFFRSYTEKFWGISADELSAEWAAQRIPVFGLRKEKCQTYARYFYYPKQGIGQIFEYIAKEVISRQGIIHLNASSSEIIIEAQRVKAVAFLQNSRKPQGSGLASDSQSHKRYIDCDYLISTIPLPELVSQVMALAKWKAKPLPCRLNGSNDGQLKAQADNLRFRSVRFLNLLIDEPQISSNTWTYVPEKRYLFTRIQEPKLRSPFNAPPGKTSLILEIPCNFQDALWNAPDEQIYQRAVSDLSLLGIELKDKVMDYFSTRVEYGYPVYALGYANHKQNLLQELSGYKNLISAGRQGLFRYLFMDQAMEMGGRLAEQIIKDAPAQGYIDNLSQERELIEGKAVV